MRDKISSLYLTCGGQNKLEMNNANLFRVALEVTEGTLVPIP